MTDDVHALDLGFGPNAGAPLPVLLATPRRTVLLFHGQRTDQPGTRHRVAVEVDGCMITKFGYPNDEALPGHPLRGRGLGYYGVFEVLDSSWKQQVIDANEIAFPNRTPPHYQALRHFVITFQDETFECLAKGLRASLAPGSFAEALHPYVEEPS